MPTRLLKRVKRWLRPPRPDARGRRFVAVIECILNQNARDDGAACSPAVDFQVLERCHAHRVGVLQMPCPEIHALGFARRRAPGERIRDALHNEACIERCATLAHEVAERIDAERMQGVKKFWSSNSRADLKVEDVRINSNQVTIGMENTDAGGVDMRVYFDQNLVPNGKSGAQLSLELIDTRGAQKGQPLLDNPYNSFNFTMDGKTVTVKSKAIDDAQTYEELATAINDALKAAGIKGVTAEVGPNFTAKDTVSGTNVQGSTIILTNSGSEILGPGNWIADGGVPPSSGLHTNMGTGAPGCTLIETDVKLDNVGRVNWDMVECGDRTVWGSGAGVLEIGAMGNRGGVQQFNVEVDRGSWLAGMSSTNMALEKVVLTNGAAKGNLYLGSAIEAGFDNNVLFAKAPTFMKNDGLVNVRELNGSAFEGQLNIGAAIDDKLYERDLDRTSGSSSSNTDNGAYKGDDLAFQYNLGKGNDLLNLSLSQKVAGDQDFSLNVNGGAGNDQVLFKFVDTAGALATANAAQKVADKARDVANDAKANAAKEEAKH